jgi:uncharacterized RDD family membrane protein YckC
MEINPPAVPAPLGFRALAAVLDSALVFLIAFLVGWQWGSETGEGERSLTGIPALLLMLGVAAFWIIPEWLSGSTPGKWACDLRVTTLRGGNISFSQSLKRNVLRLVDLMPLYLPGFVAASLTPKRQRLGDLWAKTIVISTKTKKR